MLSFINDYSEGAHPAVLQRLIDTNLISTPGYGEDDFCRSAREKILAACGCPEGNVYFLTGGTQTNQNVIDAMTEPYAGVIAADSGHVAVHEAGAIEFTGHKVLTLPSHNGKLCAEEVRQYVEGFYADDNFEHMVFPGIVYISHPTELGTLYSLEELTALHTVCQSCGIPLYLDGARLAYGLACDTDVTLPDIARLTDAFYIGGTKVGTLFGEAVVFPRREPKHFFTRIKQHGALLAKGRLLGVQFDALFTDRLYFEIGRSAIAQADRLRDALHAKGYRFLVENPTNQLIVIVGNDAMERLSRDVAFSFWSKYDDTHTAIRFVTSWATRPEDVDALIALL